MGDVDVPVTKPLAFNPGAFSCGANPGSPVTDDYVTPFRFTGTLHSATVDVSGDLITDPESETRMHMARQERGAGHALQPWQSSTLNRRLMSRRRRRGRRGRGRIATCGQK